MFTLNVLLLVPSPNNISANQRFRFEHYLPFRDEYHINFTESAFYSQKAWASLHLSGHLFQKLTGILGGFLRRFFVLFTLSKYRYVFIHRETTPVGPPVFEWLIAKVFRKRIIYDFDDAIWISIASVANPGVAWLKCTWKVANICRMSYTVTVGNDFLASYARQYCKDVRVIPTVVDTGTYHNKVKDHSEMPLTIGWTGTYTNFYNLEKVAAVINDLKKLYDVNFLIISNKDPQLKQVEYQYKKWNVQTEIQDLIEMHIGIMPLAHSTLELGKCAFKAIQYMSLGIPAVVSPVGANRVVVEDKVNGYWADTKEEWFAKLEALLIDKALRTAMGQRARQRIIDLYSVAATKEMFFNLFK